LKTKEKISPGKSEAEENKSWVGKKLKCPIELVFANGVFTSILWYVIFSSQHFFVNVFSSAGLE